MEQYKKVLTLYYLFCLVNDEKVPCNRLFYIMWDIVEVLNRGLTIELCYWVVTIDWDLCKCWVSVVESLKEKGPDVERRRSGIHKLRHSKKGFGGNSLGDIMWQGVGKLQFCGKKERASDLSNIFGPFFNAPGLLCRLLTNI